MKLPIWLKDQDYIYLGDDSAGGFISNATDGKDSIVHEFTHAVDRRMKNKFSENPIVKKAYQQFEPHLKNALKQAGLQEAPAVDNSFWGEQNIVPGVDNYTFRNPGEFVAQTMELYEEAPEKLKNMSPHVYNLYENELDRPAVA